MTTFEMAQAAYENPGKVFVGKCDTLECRIEWRGPSIHHIDGIYFGLLAMQYDGWQWEEEKQPRKVEFEAEWEYSASGLIGRMPGYYPWEELRELVGGDSAVKNTRWRVKVTAEEVL